MTTDVVAAAVLLVAGLLGVFVVIPAQTTEGEIYGLPPSLFPTVGAALLSLCCGLKVAVALGRGRASGERAEAPLTGRHWLHIASLAGGLIVCVIVIRHLGFLVGGPLTVAAAMLYMGSRKPLTIAAVAAGAPLAIDLFFWQLLSIPLP